MVMKSNCVLMRRLILVIEVLFILRSCFIAIALVTCVNLNSLHLYIVDLVKKREKDFKKEGKRGKIREIRRERRERVMF